MGQFERFLSCLQEKMPDLKVKYKNTSTLMKVISYILFFNKNFMTSFTTTLGSTIYFPSEEYVKKNEMGAVLTLAHEYVHAKDAKSISGFLFSFLYLLPLSLAPLMLLFGFVHWVLALVLFLLCLVPLPAYFRKRFELRGYIMSLFVHNELFKERKASLEAKRLTLVHLADRHNKNFTGANYYFMWPFGVKLELLKAIEDILSEDILFNEPYYLDVKSALNKRK